MISVLQRSTIKGRVTVSTIRRRASRLLSALGRDEAELVIVLTDDAEIQGLNRDFRGKDQATDVLSFPQEEGEAMPLPPGLAPPLGDVVISVETADRQVEDGVLRRLWPALGADEAPPPWALLDEVTFLLLHGVLHLVGHDHIEPEETLRMQAEEERLLPGLLNRRVPRAAPAAETA